MHQRIRCDEYHQLVEFETEGNVVLDNQPNERESTPHHIDHIAIVARMVWDFQPQQLAKSIQYNGISCNMNQC